VKGIVPMIGITLSPCEIVPSIGAGGMAEVYRARDAGLGRDVAIKVLPDTVANDPDWKRFYSHPRFVVLLKKMGLEE
jgi:serine/threonine protein kinase